MKHTKLFLGVIGASLCLNSIPAQALELTDFKLTTNKVTVNVGGTYDIDATGVNVEPRWTSWNVNKVSVSSNGVVTGLRTGSATVSARVEGDTERCTVKVVKPTIKLNKKTATIYCGEGTSTSKVQLKATAKGASKDITWTSSDESIATVDANGIVSANSMGYVIISATANGVTAECPVTVLKNAIYLDYEEVNLSTKGVGSSIKLKPHVDGSKKSVKWSTGDKKVATVSNGKVVGKGTGVTEITATANGVSTTCKVTVTQGSISIANEDLVMFTGETKTLKTNAAKGSSVSWNSTDVDVVSVNDAGVLEAKKEGYSTVTVSQNGTSDYCTVYVFDTVTDIMDDTVNLRTKGSDKVYQIPANVFGRSNKVKWTSSDKKVVTVNNKGKLTAKKAGEAEVTLTANGLTDTVKVVVQDYIPTINLNESFYTLFTGKGNTVQLKAVADGISKKVNWSSSNTDVVEVSSKGKVTAKAEGTATITAEANGVKAECLITVNGSKVILTKDKVTLKAGDSTKIGVDVVGTSQTVKYKVSDGKVASFKNGVITAKKNGEATLTATANGVTAVCQIVVADCKHDYVAGNVITEPTCTTVGYKELTCTKCGSTDKEEIAMLEHTYNKGDVVAPTCASEGYTNYVCDCGATEQRDVTAKTDHVMGDVLGVCKFCNLYMPGVYDSTGNVIMYWEDLAALANFESNFDDNGSANDPKSPGYVFTHNAVLANADTLVLGTDIETIGSCIFDSCEKELTVVIPDSVKTISASAFREFFGLKRVVLSDSIETIEQGAFEYCRGLDNVVLPNKSIDMGIRIFYGCSSLRSITIPGELKSVPLGMLGKCENLETVVVEEGIKTIEIGAFQDNPKLVNVSLPSTLREIQASAFADCTSLALEVPSTVTSIAYNAFDNVPAIKYDGSASNKPWGALSVNGEGHVGVTIPGLEDSLTVQDATVVENVLNNSVNVTVSDNDVTVSDNDIEICEHTVVDITTGLCVDCGEYVPGAYYNDGTLQYSWDVLQDEYELGSKIVSGNAFMEINRLNLSNLVLPDVKNIESWTFYRCTTLNNVVLSKWTENIDYDAFVDCLNTTVHYPEDIYCGYNIYNWGAPKSVVIPTSIELPTVEVEPEVYTNAAAPEVPEEEEVVEEKKLTPGCYDEHGNFLLPWETLVVAGFDVTNPTGNDHFESKGIGKFYLKHTHDSLGALLRETDLIVVGDNVPYIGPNAFNNYGIHWDFLWFTKVVIPNADTVVDPTAFDTFFARSIDTVCYDGEVEVTAEGVDVAPHNYVDGVCTRCGL